MFHRLKHIANAALGTVAILLFTTAWDQQAPLWYESERALDITGDGAADTIRIRAFGTVVDSLDIELTIVSQDREVYRDEWGSRAFYVVLDAIPEGQSIPGPSPDGVRNRMRVILSNSGVKRFQDWRRRWNVDARPNIAFGLNYDSLLAVMRERGTERYPKYQAGVQARQLPTDDARVDAIWEDMMANTEYVFTYSVHVEYKITIAWSSREGRFLVIDSCC